MIFDTKEFIIGGKEWKTAPFRFSKMFALGGGTGPSYIDVLLSGVSPLALTNALGLNYIKTFGATEQRNLPSDYTQVNYVTNTARTAVNTDIMIDLTKNYEFEVECLAVTGSWFILQSRESNSSPNTGITGSSSGNSIMLIVDGTNVCTNAIKRTTGNRLYVKVTLNNGTGTLYVKDITADTEDTVTGTYSTSATNPTVPLYLLGNAAGQYVDTNSNIYMARIKENGVTIMDYVPCRQDTTAGFYDKVNETFKTATTLSAGADVTTPSPDNPMDIICNNGVLKVNNQGQIYAEGTQETVNITGKNLWNPNGIDYGWITTSGDLNPSRGSSRRIEVEYGETYTYKSQSSVDNFYNCIALYDENMNFISRSRQVISTGLIKTNTVTITNVNTKYMVCGYYVYEGVVAPEQSMIVKGDGDTPYEPYFNGGTANAEMLLKIGTYQDNQELLTGNITRNVGIKVFNGTEDWNKSGSSALYYRFLIRNVTSLWNANADVLPLCTHVIGQTGAEMNTCFFSNDFVFQLDKNLTVAELKQWLADQYNAGTPVIIVYPLATPITETVSGQSLTVSGNCTVTAAGSIDNLELELSYKQSI